MKLGSFSVSPSGLAPPPSSSLLSESISKAVHSLVDKLMSTHPPSITASIIQLVGGTDSEREMTLMSLTYEVLQQKGSPLVIIHLPEECFSPIPEQKCIALSYLISQILVQKPELFSLLEGPLKYGLIGGSNVKLLESLILTLLRLPIIELVVIAHNSQEKNSQIDFFKDLVHLAVKGQVRCSFIMGCERNEDIGSIPTDGTKVIQEEVKDLDQAMTKDRLLVEYINVCKVRPEFERFRDEILDKVLGLCPSPLVVSLFLKLLDFKLRDIVATRSQVMSVPKELQFKIAFRWESWD